MGLTNFENLVVPGGIILLIWFMTQGESKKDEDEDDWAEYPGLAQPTWMGDTGGRYRGKSVGGGSMYGGVAHSVSKSVYDQLLERGKEEGGDVTRTFLRDGRAQLAAQDQELKRLEEKIERVRRTEDREDTAALADDLHEFEQKFGSLEAIGGEYVRVLQGRHEQLEEEMENPKGVYVFGEDELLYSQEARRSLFFAIAEVLQQFQTMQAAASEIEENARQLILTLEDSEPNRFRQNDEWGMDDDGEPKAQRETSASWMSAPPANDDERSGFASLASAPGRLKQQAGPTMSRLDFNAPGEAPPTAPPDSFRTLTAERRPRSIEPKTLDFAGGDLMARRGNASFNTPEKAMPPIPEAPKEYKTPTRLKLDQVERDLEELVDLNTPGIAPARPKTPPHPTPVSKMYKDPDQYAREAERIQGVVSQLGQSFRALPHDQSNLNELQKAMKRANPPAFVKNSWWDAATKEQSAQTTVGTPVRYSKLMQDPVFEAYAALAQDIDKNLSL